MANTRLPIDYSKILWSGGKPFWQRADGSKVFLPPATAAQTGDRRAVEWAKSMGYSIGDEGVINDVFSNHGTSLLKNRGNWNPDTGEIDQGINWNNIMAMGVGAQIGAPYLMSALGSGAPAAGAAPETAAASQVPEAAAGAKKVGFFSKLFGKGGLDPTMLALGGLSMLGGDDEPGSSTRKSFEGTGADPVRNLEETLAVIKSLGAQLGAKPIKRLDRTVQRGPAPVQIDGLPFQIGGGLGEDPALRTPASNPAEDGRPALKFNPFDSIDSQPDLMNPEGTNRTATRRREP